MALTGACRRLWSLTSSPRFWKPTEFLGSGSVLDSQLRSFAKDAGPKKPGASKKAPPPPKDTNKAPTPNAAKASKAKNATKKEEQKEQRDRNDELIDACLNAPSPLSPLKAKERLRLLEREKLGIFTPERLREIEQEKVKEKAVKAAAKKKAGQDENSLGKDGTETRNVLSETPGEETRFELTAEEGKRLAKEQSRFLMKKERERGKIETARLEMKKAAIAALPPNLRAAALVPDLTPFPQNRIAASLTPPIQGYIEDRAKAAAHAVTVKKTR